MHIYLMYYFAECRCAECRYDECRYAECRSAMAMSTKHFVTQIIFCQKMWLEILAHLFIA